MISDKTKTAAQKPHGFWFGHWCVLFVGFGALALLVCGCTPIGEYIHNGFKVGPNYHKPPAPVAAAWIDAADVRVRTDSAHQNDWWTLFNDPVLDSLICLASRQNLSLRAAAFRVLEARAQLRIDIGGLLPQKQAATGDFQWIGISTETANNFLSIGTTPAGNNVGVPSFKRFFSQWDFGFNLSWELDLWGRIRRLIEADADTLDASIEDYDNVLVTLLGDVASNYVQYRTLERRIKFARDNVEAQQQILKIVLEKRKAGVEGGTELDVAQSRSTVELTQASIPELQISLRQAANQLCILLGIPPEELREKLGSGGIPTAPPDVAAGIPANLLRRRPDVRKAEREVAAQNAQIGVAEAEFYPHFYINGTWQYSAERFKDVFNSQALNGNIGPAFQWNILQYGRILNNVRRQDARFQELVANYQNTVLNAAKEVENGLVTFLRAQERTKYQAASAEDSRTALRIVGEQFSAGIKGVDLTRVTQLQLTVVQLDDTLAQAQGEIALGLIQTYRALGGGWQIRITGCNPTIAPVAGSAAKPGEAPATLPAPTPQAPAPAVQEILQTGCILPPFVKTPTTVPVQQPPPSVQFRGIGLPQPEMHQVSVDCATRLGAPVGR
jgi:NodT family efflux transporter outer membrane factor (OMF) lipoprotein